MMGAKHGDHRSRARFVCQPQGAFDQRFPIEFEQLLRPPQAQASSSSKKNGGNRHRNQFNRCRLTKDLFERQTEPDRGGNRLSDLERILPLWRELERERRAYVLATIIAVEGSSYRKPGALMLLAEDGRRAGTVSGGCLEAEVAQRAWWLTQNGPVVQAYSTSDDDGERPYGSGCGGRVYLLLERKQSAGPLLAALSRAFEQRVPCAVATVVEGPQLGRHAFAVEPAFGPERLIATTDSPHGSLNQFADTLRQIAELALARRISMEQTIATPDGPARVWADFRPARPGLWIFGAGDDAQPLHRMASELGWFVAVQDGRAHLATRERFLQANQVNVLPKTKTDSSHPGSADLVAGLRSTDAAVLVTHSFDQDVRVLGALFELEFVPAYIGVLGPQRRTREILKEVLGTRVSTSGLHSETENRIDRLLEQLHAPMGIDLGADTPATIALSILAEIQKRFAHASALPLREVRADRITVKV
jgi:xanthine/CO dehydrogenase XdhC/CoxF family maturation factor